MSSEEPGNGNGGGHGWGPLIAVVSCVLLALVLAEHYGFRQNLPRVQSWIKSFGIWAPVAFSLIYIGATLTGFPITALSAAAGVLFGSILGVLYTNVAATIGAVISFLIARYFARDAVTRWLSRYKRFRRLNNLTEKHGSIIIAVTRLAPVFPFAFLNYGFGLTKVSFWPYLFWTWCCMLPSTIAVVVGGDAAVKAIAQGRVPWELIAPLIAISILLVLMYWMADRHFAAREAELAEELSQQECEPDDPTAGDLATR